MSPLERLSRRDLLRSSFLAGLGAAIPALATAAPCLKSPAQVEGPFYMNTWDRTKPVPHQNDLTWVGDPNRKAEGEVIHLEGQVTDLECRPAKGAVVEIWQACRTGRYAHMMDPNPAWLDPNFRYFGEFVTDENGMYSFKTIKPGTYPVGPSWIRPAHVHFKITAGLKLRMLTTQMYFAGDPYLKTDRLVNSIPKSEQNQLIIEPTRYAGTGTENLYRFNIHLPPLEI